MEQPIKSWERTIWTRMHGLPRRARGAMAMLATGLLLFGASAIANPAPASAHNYGHTCSPRIAADGFSCTHRHGIAADGEFDQILMYYDGELRSGILISYTSPVVTQYVAVCDQDAGDNTNPRARIDIGSVVREFSTTRGDCSRYNVTLNVDRFRALNRNNSGAVTHGTIWYQSPI